MQGNRVLSLRHIGWLKGVLLVDNFCCQLILAEKSSSTSQCSSCSSHAGTPGCLQSIRSQCCKTKWGSIRTSIGCAGAVLSLGPYWLRHRRPILPVPPSQGGPPTHRSSPCEPFHPQPSLPGLVPPSTQTHVETLVCVCKQALRVCENTLLTRNVRAPEKVSPRRWIGELLMTCMVRCAKDRD